MDPIEKLLSELAPRNVSSAFDDTMHRLFARADARARRRRVVRAALSFGVTLAMGIVLGARIGSPRSSGSVAEPTAPAPVTYVYSIEPSAAGTAFDFSTSETMRRAARNAALDQSAVVIIAPAVAGGR